MVMNGKVKLAVILVIAAGVAASIILPVVPFLFEGSAFSIKEATSMSCVAFGHGVIYSNTLGMGWSNDCSDPSRMGWGVNGSSMLK
jgi:hypothetical protein